MSNAIRSRRRWRRRLWLAVVLFLGGAVSVVSGQPLSTTPAPSSPLVTVTWAEIVRLVDQHPRLAVGQSQIAAARGGLRAAGAVPNPTF